MSSVSFPDLEDTLAEIGSLAEAAEAHGSLCGALCAEPRFSLDSWLDELLQDPAQVSGWRGVFESVYSDTRQALGGESMQFEPLLPDDDQPLTGRTLALAAWCQGFLYGLGTSGLHSVDDLPGDVAEVIQDLTEISHASFGNDQATDTDEQAYAELVEFVRVGVQLIYDELAQRRSPPLPDPPRVH
ncbi:MAG TPA: UPF0149 family protein [Steroidobacteraceae bacterium]|nr:UPF0149 family protein [Steroidobacteraceae bacterium]